MKNSKIFVSIVGLITSVAVGLVMSSQTQLQIHQAKLEKNLLKQESKKAPTRQSPDGAGEYYANKRLAKNITEIPAENYTNAIRAKRSYLNSQPIFSAEPWQTLGPNFVGGRTRSLVFHPDTPEIIYAAGVSGGVWKSTNSGASWAAIGDDLENIAVVTLAILPNSPNILLAGTGEGVYVGRPIVRSRGVEGNGIYRTLDNGQTWQVIPFTLNNPDFRFVNKIRAAQDGALFAATVRGLWRSIDNGDNWQLMLDQADRVGGCHELEIQPASSPNSLLASCGSFETAAVYQSDNNGENWRIVLEKPNQGRTTIAYAPSNPSRVYALSAQNQFGSYPYGLNGLYRSDNGGSDWVLTASPESDNPNSRAMLSTTDYVFDCWGTGQYQGGRLAGGGWYYNLIVVDPTNQDRVWTGGLDLWRSDDAGVNFNLGSFWWASEDEASYIHGDHHLLVYHPNYNGTTETRLFASNDGGIWQTTNPSARLATNNCAPESSLVDWRSLNNNYAVTQFYHGSVSRDGLTLIGGSQDNGTQWRSSTGEWALINGGDGSYSAIDPKDPANVYVSSQYANLVKIKIQAGENQSTPISGSFDAPGLFITPFELDKNNNQRLWLAGVALWRGDTNGQWVKASRNEYTMNYIDGLSAVSVQPGNSDLVLLGGTDGNLFRHTNALSGTASTIMEKIKLSDGYISSINFDRNNVNKVVASVSTFGEIHAWLSEDAGVNWQVIDEAGESGLPDLPTHDIIIAPHDTNILYAATDIGVYVSENNGGSWLPLTSGMPNVPVEKLEYRRNNQQTSLFAFTYGRGAFKTQINDVTNFNPFALQTAIEFNALEDQSIVADLSKYFDDPNDDPLIFTASNLPAGMTLSAQGILSGSISSTGTYSVTLVASDELLEATSILNFRISEKAVSSSGGGAFHYLIVFLMVLLRFKKQTVFNLNE